jgi:hypothetical protein
MMKALRLLALLSLLLHYGTAQAQERFFEYVPGWQNNFSTETEDGYLLFGLGFGGNSPTDHFFQFNEINFQGVLTVENTVDPEQL